MRINLYKIFLLFCILGLVACNRTSEEDFDKFYKEFKKPAKEYRPAPLYVWNTHITPEILDRTMNELHQQEFGGVFVHPRPGLKTEYLSDEWFFLFRHALDNGKKLDMNVWIYDENSYPSGFAGGHVNAEMPESYNQGGSIVLCRYEMLPEKIENLYLCLKEIDGNFIDITEQLTSEYGKKGQYYVYIKSFEPRTAWYGGYSYVDLLYPGVTQKFLEVTGKGYECIASEEFGKYLPGWFTDEPHIWPSGGGIRWTSDLFEVFLKRWGYDLKTNLPSLSLDVGPWKKVRHNYYQTLLELFIDRWAKPCYQYCEERGLQFTGHYWEHVWPVIGYGPDNMAMYAWQHMPGIDMLKNQFNEVEPQAQFGNVRSVKEVRSVANQLGRKRILCETYGAAGWEETFEDFKRLGDWQTVLGVNFMNQHLSHLSLAGDRKYDCPPSFSAHSPWWSHYKELNRHFSRLSVATTMGEQLNDILIIEPTTTIWFYNIARASPPRLWEIGRNFQRFVTTLEKAQSEYDLGSEQVIREHGFIRQGYFNVGQRAYSTVVIPPLTENLNKQTFELLKEFVLQGGKIISFATPTLIDGCEDKEVTRFFTEYSAVIRETELSSKVITTHFQSKDFQLKRIVGGNLFHQRREFGDGQLLLLVNSSLEELTVGTIQMPGSNIVELNTFTGNVFDYPEESVSKDSLIFDFNLSPGGSLLLYIFNKVRKNFPPSYHLIKKMQVAAATPLTVQPVQPNVLAIDFCDLKLGSDYLKDIHIYEADQLVYQHYGFPEGNPWRTAIQYKDNIVSRDTMTNEGFSATYRFLIEENVDYSTLKAVVECAELYIITINGKEISNYSDEWWIDRDFRILPIGSHVHLGENNLTISIKPMKLDAELAPIYILGDFRLCPANQGWIITSPQKIMGLGSWKSQGWPFYPHAMLYTQTFIIPSTLEPFYEVQLGKWNGTVAEVIVNGKSAGVIGFKPYTLDVSRWIQPGKNQVEIKVIGSNKNIFGPFHNESSIGIVTPDLYRGTTEWPSGGNYIQLDYGLYEPFKLVSGH